MKKHVESKHSNIHAEQVSMRSFTLIELLVVIAIIAILAAILMPALTQARERGKAATCTNTMKNMMLAVHQYLDNNNGIIYGQYGSTTWPSYSFALRTGNYLPAHSRNFQCSKADGVGYIKIGNRSASAIFTKFNKNKDPYADEATKYEYMAIDHYAYSINYSFLQHSGSRENYLDANNGKAKIKHPDSNDICALISHGVKKPAGFLFIADGKTYGSNGYNAHLLTLWFKKTTWGAQPWAAHSSERMNTAWLDGHVEAADRAKINHNIYGIQYNNSVATVEFTE